MEGNDLKTFENLCKIFEMRIKLDREKDIDTSEEVINNYEKYSKKIDNIYNSKFQIKIKPLLSPESTLEDEKERLVTLVLLLEERLKKREELEDKFYLTTGKYIKNLQPIVSEVELNDKKERLEAIERYLETTSEIDSVTESLGKLKNSLEEEEEKKNDYLAKNKIMEEELAESFIAIIKEDNYYKDLEKEDISKELINIVEKVRESKETLDVTKDSISSLMDNGTDDDYSSYIEEAEKTYFVWEERELVLRIYDLVLDTFDSFNELYDKRLKISDLLEERRNLRSDLNIDTANELLNFEKVLAKELNTLEEEKEVLENISSYTSRIKFKEDKLEELDDINNSVEILAILREYGLIDTYEREEIDSETLSLDDVYPELEQEESIVKEVIDPYRIVDIKGCPLTFNLGLAKLKGTSIRDKVNRKLNPQVEVPKLEEVISEEVVSPVETIEEVNSYEEVVPSEESNSFINIPPMMSFHLEEPKEEKVESSTPIWEIPSDVKAEPLKVEDTKGKAEDIQLWNVPVDTIVNEPKEEKVENIPMWEIPSDTSVNVNTPKVESNNNMFWTSASADKVEASSNIPIYKGFVSGENEFVFPSINNN